MMLSNDLSSVIVSQVMIHSDKRALGQIRLGGATPKPWVLFSWVLFPMDTNLGYLIDIGCGRK